MNSPLSSSLAEAVLERLRELIDPEFGLSVVDLGLIYRVEAENRCANVTMTLTTPGCPIGAVLAEGVRHLAATTPGIERVEVNLVWTPPWSPSMLSSAARKVLGFPTIE